MRGNELLDNMELVDATYVEAADKRPTRVVWIRWVAVAACLCLVLVGVLVMGQNTDHSFEKVPTVLYGELEYAICGSEGEATILVECGLPTELTGSLAGEVVAYLEFDGESCYNVSGEETETVMYEYKPDPGENVYIVLINGTYYAAIRHDADGYHGVQP